MQLWGLLFFTAAAQGAFQIDLLLFHRKLGNWSNRLLLILLLLPTLSSLDYLLITSGWYLYFPHLFGVSFGLIFLLAPTLFFYTKSLLNESFFFQKKDLMHLLPFIIAMLGIIPIFSLDESRKVLFITNYLLQGIYIDKITYLFYFSCILQIGFYLVLINKETKEKCNTNLAKLAWIKVLYFVLMVFTICLAAAYLHSIWLGKYTLSEVYVYALGNSLIVFVISARLFQNNKEILEENPKKYLRSSLNEQDKLGYAKTLNILMENEKCYLQPELKLNEVAQQLQISPQQLSEVINHTFQQSFNDYINSFRVEYFKNALQNTDNEQFTILALAYEAGFNSKNTFNTAFKKATGMTPSDYKKQKTSS